MAGRLKVTGWLDADDLALDGYLDSSHSTGLSDRGYDEVMNYTLSDLDGVRTELED